MSRRQATVRSFSPHTHAGSVLFDDGTLAEFDAQACATSGWRLLRPGQRVDVCWQHGEVTALALPGALRTCETQRP